MKIRVLGCAGTVSPEVKTSAFLINDRILLDAGTICSSLPLIELKNLKNIFVSHPHFDHIKGIPSFAETLIFLEETTPAIIYGSSPAIDSLSQHIMNGVIWPDFTILPAESSPVLKYCRLSEGESVSLDGLTITPHFLYRNISDFGYLVDDGMKTLLYTSDIGPDAVLCPGGKVPDSIIIEVSFPNRNEELALRSGHLTPLLMQDMLKKLPTQPACIFVSHIKTYFREQVIQELDALGLENLIILKDGDEVRL